MNQSSLPQARPGDAADLAQRLWFVVLVLLVLFVAGILNASLPLRVLDPRWQQRLIHALLTQGFLPLIAILLLHLAVVLDPTRTRLRRRRDRFSRLASLAPLGFLLLLPLQFIASWGSVQAIANNQTQQQTQGLAAIRSLRQAITAATSHRDLDSRLQTLPIPVAAASPADLALPFTHRQNKLLAGLAASEHQLSAKGVPPSTNILPALIEPSLRVAPAAFALAGGFAVFSFGANRSANIRALEDHAYFETIGRESER